MFRFMSNMFDRSAEKLKERKDAADYCALKKKERADLAERTAIAKAFNDRYTYCERYVPFGAGQDLYTSFAWMCPVCNKVHLSLSHSFLSGMQYPACCTYPEGHRHFDKIKCP